MSEVFRTVLNAGFQGGIVIVMVLLLRLVLRRAPKKYICLLWILVGVRLLLPFSLESALSLQPAEEIISQKQWQDLRDYGEIIPEDAPMELPQPYVPEVVDQIAVDDLPEHPEVTVTYQTEIIWAIIVPWIWLTGVGLLGIYSLVSWLLLKRRVREAVHLADDVWECAGLGTAFILGYLRPRIYIPMGISGESRCHILKHERCHLKRLDHWVKLIGFIALTVHWFNPLVWVFYGLLCRDIEMACDESVVRDMSLEERKRYSAALLECSAGRIHWAACPVAFGEVSVRQRILGVLNYRRPRFWLTLLAVAAIVFVAVCFLTSPVERIDPLTLEDWGITLETDHVTPEGLSLSITQSGTLVMQELYYGRDFHVERWSADGWEAVEPVIENWGFTTEAIQLPQNQTTRLEINWAWLYGQLPAGTYRIGKSIHNDVRVPIGVNLPGVEQPEEQNYTYYAEFTVPGVRSASDAEILDYCRSALEGWKALESVALLCSNEFHTEKALNHYSVHQFWIDGGNWYRVTDIQEALTTDYTLFREGKLYERAENGHYPEVESVWEEIPSDRAEEYLPWLCRYAWNEDRISLVSSQTADGSVWITLRVEEELTMAGLTAPEHFLVFEFGGRDVLSSVSLGLNSTGESVSMTVQLPSTDRVEIAGVIDEAWQQIAS